MKVLVQNLKEVIAKRGWSYNNNQHFSCSVPGSCGVAPWCNICCMTL